MTDKAFAINVGAGVLTGAETGDGPALLMLHGGPGLTDYMSLLAGETAGWRAIRYQQRGLAPSLLDGPFTVDQHVNDVIAVLDGLGLDRVPILGHSWGAHLALQVAAAVPDRITGLVLVDGLGVAEPDGGAGQFGQGLISRLTPERAEKLGELGARIGDRMPTDAEADEQLALLWPSYYADPAQAPSFPAGMHTSVAGNLAASMSVAESLAAGFAARLTAVTAPAVVLLGELSTMPHAVGEQVAACLPNAEVVVVPGAGHLTWHERPGCVASALTTMASRAAR
jgi:pimeloyl-ACP methyl ester carboxylesterase